MKNKLPCFTLAWILIGPVAAVGQTIPAESSAAGMPAAAPAPIMPANLPQAPAGAQADQLIEAAQAALVRTPSLTAKVRQQIDLFGHRLIGDGKYIQSGVGDDLLVRYELKVQTANEVTSLLQVSDGRFLWTDEQFGEERSVSRVDLGQITASFRDSGRDPAMLTSGRLALGGIAEFLSSAHANFQFTLAGEKQLQGVAVYSLIGRWRPDCLAALLPKQAKAIKAGQAADMSSLPHYIPHDMVVLLGRDDLFPYVLDFRRYEPTGPGEAPRPALSILRMQLYEVNFGAQVDLRNFVYKPGAIHFDDETKSITKLQEVREYRTRMAK